MREYGFTVENVCERAMDLVKRKREVEVMRVGIAADHAGFALKEQLAKALRESGHEVLDFGSSSLTPEDDYPDYVVPLARSVAMVRSSAGWRSAEAEWERASLPTR